MLLRLSSLRFKAFDVCLGRWCLSKSIATLRRAPEHDLVLRGRLVTAAILINFVGQWG